MLASDVAALGGQATNYMVVPEYHVVELHTDDIRVYNMKNELCEAEFLDIDWDTTRAGKGNYGERNHGTAGSDQGNTGT